ncbi:MAG: hypothetical protein OEW84_03705 [Aigarchaeota archaeon]|nr:hypothetical protein [Aigarchaeota archaeon]
MGKKTRVWLAILSVGIAVVGGWFVLSSRLQTSNEGFGIYLLENNELVISDKDIASYNKTSHEIKLNEEGVRKIEALSYEVPVYGKPFVVKLNDRQIYNGSFWSPISSVAASGIVIDTFVQHNTIRIEAGYPSSEFFKGIDPRNNSEIFEFFRGVGKLT